MARGRPRKLETMETKMEKAIENKVEERGRDDLTTRVDDRETAEKNRDLGENERIPVGLTAPKMTVNHYNNKLQGKSTRWFNDDGDRIQRALMGGWHFVKKHGITTGVDHKTVGDPGVHVTMHVGKHDGGLPKYAYLMAIDKELYEQDQKAKQDRVDEIDQAIQHGFLAGKEKNLTGEVKYQTNSRS